MKYPAISELKYDGSFNFLYFNKDGNDPTHVITNRGNCRYDFDALNMIHDTLVADGHFNGIFLCECYWDTGKAGKLYELNSHKNDNGVKICIFDIYSLDDMMIKDTTLIDRKEILLDLFGSGSRFLPKFKTVEDRGAAEQHFHEMCNDGWEGTVVKNLDEPLVLGPCSWVKIKWKDQSDYEVHMVDQTQERMEVLCPHPSTFVNNAPITPKMVNVGVSCPNRFKKYINAGDTVTIEHQGVLPSGSLRHPVLIKKKEWK